MLEREQASWQHGKGPLVSKYLDDHAKMMTEIAGRGFLSLPGYSYDIENSLELMTKMGLSELNYKILKESIDLELRQTGIDYDNAYRSALLAWEIEKQVLMIAWESEYAGIKRGQSSEENILSLLAVEVSKRAIILLQQKTVIELAMETYRTTLAGLDSTVSSYEVQLANAKLLTTQKKANIIPILEGINSQEQLLLAEEQKKAAAYTALVAAEKAVADKKEDLIIPMGDLVNKTEEHTAKITTEQTVKERLIADEKMTQLEFTQTITEKQLEELSTDLETETKRLELITKKRELDDTQFDNAQEVIAYQTTKKGDYQTDVQTKFGTMMTAEEIAQQTLIDNEKTVYDKHSLTRSTSVTKVMNAETGLSSLGVTEAARELAETVEANMAAKLTASLEHLIG